jgi:NADPH:quinone reductase-like Zn-dependent oxidoreductase
VLVRVCAAGVTPTEAIWYPTTHTKDGNPRLSAVPGHEFSGTIAAVDGQSGGFQEGDAVYGMNDWFAEGATAEYCLAAPAHLCLKPDNLSHAQAATVPIGALTAWQGLFDRAGLRSGERVLVHGGAGAVGLFAIQLARRAGAHVVTTASARHSDFLRQLGAERVLDYRAERFEEQLRDLDVVFDGVGGETLQRSWSVLKPGGRLVTIAASSEGKEDERTKSAFFIVEPSRQQLEEISTLLERNELRTFVDAEVPLANASDAYFGAVARQHGRGKIVVTI